MPLLVVSPGEYVWKVMVDVPVDVAVWPFSQEPARWSGLDRWWTKGRWRLL